MWKRDKSSRLEAKDKRAKTEEIEEGVQFEKQGRANVGEMKTTKRIECLSVQSLTVERLCPIRAEWSLKELQGTQHNQLTVTKLLCCFFYWDFSTT